MRSKLFFLLIAFTVLSFPALSESLQNYRQIFKAQIPFVKNEGQLSNKIVFYARTFAGAVFITKDGKLVYLIRSKKKKAVLKEVILTSKKIKTIIGEEKAVTKVSYFKGKDKTKWKTNIPTYRKLNLGKVYKGINLYLKAYGKNVEKIFVVGKNGNPQDIKLKIEGAENLKVNKDGELEIVTQKGTVKFSIPVAYQDIKGKRKFVDISYSVSGNIYSFKVGKYNRNYPLIIDPLLASTFVGGGSYDYSYSIALDSNGNVFVAGETWDATDYPFTTDMKGSGGSEIVVSKFSSDMSSLLSSVIIGGLHDESAKAVAVDSSNNVYITGLTLSSDFPTTSGAFDTIHNGSADIFISKLSNDLSTLIASTYFGENSNDYGSDIVIDSSGDVFIAGYTSSAGLASLGYDLTYNGGTYDIIVARFSNDLSSSVYSTYLGGSQNDYAYGIDIDSNGNVFIAGSSTSSDYPTAGSPYRNTYDGGNDVVVSKLNNTLTSLLASTYIDGASDDIAYDILIDSSDNIYITGFTVSTDYTQDYLTTVFTNIPYDYTHNGSGTKDIFITKLKNDLSEILATTFLGGDSDEEGKAIVMDSSNNVIVVGHTKSSNFPTTDNAYNDTINSASGYYDVVVSKLDNTLENLLASTFVGGRYDEYGEGIILDSSGNILITGYTYSSKYPTTSGAYDTSFNGTTDIFVSKFDSSLENSPPEIYSFTVEPSSGSKPLEAVFKWNVKDPENDSINCYLDTNNNGTYEYFIQDCSPNYREHYYVADGNYTAKLEVVDSRGNKSVQTVAVSVNTQSTAGSDSGGGCSMGKTNSSILLVLLIPLLIYLNRHYRLHRG